MKKKIILVISIILKKNLEMDNIKELYFWYGPCWGVVPPPSLLAKSRVIHLVIRWVWRLSRECNDHLLAQKPSKFCTCSGLSSHRWTAEQDSWVLYPTIIVYPHQKLLNHLVLVFDRVNARWYNWRLLTCINLTKWTHLLAVNHAKKVIRCCCL